MRLAIGGGGHRRTGEAGTTLVEWAILVTLLAIVCVLAILVVGNR